MEAVDRHERCLLIALIGGRFAGHGRVSGHVEDVVLNLEREANGLAVTPEARRFLRVRAGKHRAGDRADGDECAGFSSVQRDEFRMIQLLRFGGEIEHLTVHHARRTRI